MPNRGVTLGSITELNNGSNYDSFPGACKCHNGDWLVGYRGGVNAHDITNGGYLLTQRYTTSWASAVTLQSAEASTDLRETSLIKLQDDDKIGCFYTAVPSSGHSASNEIRWILSSDDGATWGSPVTITHGASALAIVSCPPIQLPNGRIIVAVRTRDVTYDSTELWYSDNNGTTWVSLATVGDGDTDERHYSEPSLAILPSGDLLCLMRDHAPSPDQIYYATSSDSGSNWSTPATAFQSDSAPKCWVFSDGIYASGDSIDQELFSTVEASLGSWTKTVISSLGTFANYGAFIDNGTELHLVWSEDPTETNASGTDSDLKMRQVATATPLWCPALAIGV